MGKVDINKAFKWMCVGGSKLNRSKIVVSQKKNIYKNETKKATNYLLFTVMYLFLLFNF